MHAHGVMVLETRAPSRAQCFQGFSLALSESPSPVMGMCLLGLHFPLVWLDNASVVKHEWHRHKRRAGFPSRFCRTSFFVRHCSIRTFPSHIKVCSSVPLDTVFAAVRLLAENDPGLTRIGQDWRLSSSSAVTTGAKKLTCRCFSSGRPDSHANGSCLRYACGVSASLNHCCVKCTLSDMPVILESRWPGLANGRAQAPRLATGSWPASWPGRGRTACLALPGELVVSIR